MKIKFIKIILKPLARLCLIIGLVTIVPWFIYFLITGGWYFELFENVDKW